MWQVNSHHGLDLSRQWLLHHLYRHMAGVPGRCLHTAMKRLAKGVERHDLSSPLTTL